MAHFAELGTNNQVVRVVVVHNNVLLDENTVEQEQLGKDFCVSIFGGNWIQTSYNHTFRGRFAGLTDFYDPDLDEFVAPKSLIIEP